VGVRTNNNPRYLPKGARVDVWDAVLTIGEADPQSATELRSDRSREMNAIALSPLLGNACARRSDEPGHYQEGEAGECDCDHFLAPSAEAVDLAVRITDWKSI